MAVLCVCKCSRSNWDLPGTLALRDYNAGSPLGLVWTLPYMQTLPTGQILSSEKTKHRKKTKDILVGKGKLVFERKPLEELNNMCDSLASILTCDT